MKVVAVNGSLRRNSSNAALLRAAARVAPAGFEIALYDGLGRLPHFNPDLDEEGMTPHHEVSDLRRLLIDCDAVLISCPEYAHGVPGALKNMLDWLVSTGELANKPVGLLNASPSGGTYAQASLVETLRTMNWAVLEDASLVEPFVSRKIAGELTDEAALDRLREAMNALHERLMREKQ